MVIAIFRLVESSLFVGGPIFVAFVSNLCPQIYIPKNVTTSIWLIFIKIITNFVVTNKITSPWTRKMLAFHKNWPQQIKMIHSIFNSFWWRALWEYIGNYSTLNFKCLQFLLYDQLKYSLLWPKTSYRNKEFNILWIIFICGGQFFVESQPFPGS